jgi:hypothetical protein
LTIEQLFNRLFYYITIEANWKCQFVINNPFYRLRERKGALNESLPFQTSTIGVDGSNSQAYYFFTMQTAEGNLLKHDGISCGLLK